MDWTCLSKYFTWIGRFAFLVIYFIQAGFLAKYLSDLYDPEHATIVLSLLPGFVLWLGLVIRYHLKKERPIIYVWIVWLLYTFGFVVSVACIFAKEVEKLDKSKFFGPNVLKTTLCLAPVLLLLLLNTTISARKNPKLIERLSMAIALDIFDGIEMLDILLLQGHELTVSEAMKIAMVSFVCVSFLLSSVSLCQHKFDLEQGIVKSRRKVTLYRALCQITLVNGVFLILRLVLLFKYKFSASIFLTKNIISLVFCAIEAIFVLSEEYKREEYIV